MKKTLIAAAVFAAAQPLLSSAQELEQVTVTGNRVETPKSQLGVSVSVVTAADIERLGYTSLLDVIRTLPGVSVSNSGGAGKVSNVYLRGESGSRTLVLLDGVNIADPTNTQVTSQFQHLQSADIERIEVLRGPQGMMYGAGAGGVINIISKKSEAPLQGRVSAEIGRYGAQQLNASLGGNAGDWDYGVSVSDFHNEGFNSRESDTSGERDGYDNLTASARLGYQASENLSFLGEVRRIDAETEFDNCYDASFSPINDCLDDYAQTSFRLAGSYSGENSGHDVSVARQQIERDSLSAGASIYVVEGAIEELNYIGHGALAGGELLWGAELENQDYEGFGSQQEVESLGLFSEWRGDVAERVFYTLGYRRDSLENDDHNSWRASVAYPVLLGEQQQLKYRASYGTGYRAPSPYEVSTNLAQDVEAVGPETSEGYELGLEYQWAEALQVELVYFDQEVTDAIVYDYSLGNFGAYGQDDGESQSRGVELSLAGDFDGGFGWYVNGTWLDSEDTAGEQRLQVPQRVYNLGLSYALLDNRLEVSSNWQRVEDRLDVSGVILDDYSKLDLKAAYRLTDKVRFSLRGENVLDEDYREVGGFYTAGAAVYAGIQLAL